MSTIPVLLAISVLVFGMIHLLPGDPVALMMEESGLSKEDLEQIRQALGLNDPLPVQYLRYLGKLLRGDLGRSIRSDIPVARTILSQIRYTIELAASGLTISVTLGVLAGVAAAVRRKTWVDAVTMFVSLLGLSMPSFWMGLLFIIVFSFGLGWLPSVGAGSFKQLIMPAIVLGIHGMGSIARLTRSSVLEVLRLDYVRTARAKGLSERVVLYKHALRNALLPVITVIGVTVGSLLSGAVVVETVFTRPGLGRISVDAISGRDFPIVQASVLLSSLMYVGANLFVDISCVFVDPRIRFD
jgi:ABC-type dipeptide/oligopeptide/nickel transport system permease component